MPMSAWDDLSDEDRAWHLATMQADSGKCPICGGDDPEQWCQNPAMQHAWVVDTRRCYKQRAVLMAMERFKADPYVSTIVPRVTLDPARIKN